MSLNRNKIHFLSLLILCLFITNIPAVFSEEDGKEYNNAFEIPQVEDAYSMVQVGNNIIISDLAKKCVHIIYYDENNEEPFSYKGCYKGGIRKSWGKMDSPFGMYSYGNFFYVADMKNKRILRCNTAGDCTAKQGTDEDGQVRGLSNLKFLPTGVFCDGKDFYVVGLKDKNKLVIASNRKEIAELEVEGAEDFASTSVFHKDDGIYFSLIKFNNGKIASTGIVGILKYDHTTEKITEYKHNPYVSNFKYLKGGFIVSNYKNGEVDSVFIKGHKIILKEEKEKGTRKYVLLVEKKKEEKGSYNDDCDEDKDCNENKKLKCKYIETISKKLCVCKEGYEWNKDNEICVKEGTTPGFYHDKCDDKTDVCLEYLGLECVNNKCECKKGYLWDDQNQRCVEESKENKQNEELELEKSDCAASPSGEPGCKTAPCGKCSVLNVPYRCKCRVLLSEGKRVKSCVGVFDEECCLKGFKYLTKDINGKEISACFPKEAESKDDFDGKDCYENGGRCLNGTFFKNEYYGHFKSVNYKCPSGTVCLVEKAENELQENEKCGHKGEKCCLNGCYQGLTCCKSKNYEQGVCLQNCTLGQGAEEVVGCCVTAEGCTTIYNEDTTSCNTNNSNNKFVEKESCDSVELCTNGCCVIATKDSITHFVGSKYKCELTSSKITSSDGQKYTYIFNKSITKKEECDGLSNKFQASDFYSAFGFKASINASNSFLTYDKDSKTFEVCTDGFYKLSKEENANEISVSLDYTLNGNCNKVKVSLGDQEVELEKTEKYKSITLSYNKDNSNDVDKVKMSITLNTPASDTTNSEYCCLNVKNLKIESSNKSG